MFAGIPENLLNELHQAAIKLDIKAISEVIDRIEPLAPDTAKDLKSLLKNYRLGRITDLLGNQLNE